jgi:hypothetical protein
MLMQAIEKTKKEEAGTTPGKTFTLRSIFNDADLMAGRSRVVFVDFSAIYHAWLQSVPDNLRRALVDALLAPSGANDVPDVARRAAALSHFVENVLFAFFAAVGPDACRKLKFVLIAEGSSKECVRRVRVMVWLCGGPWHGAFCVYFFFFFFLRGRRAGRGSFSCACARACTSMIDVGFFLVHGASSHDAVCVRPLRVAGHH